MYIQIYTYKCKYDLAEVRDPSQDVNAIKSEIFSKFSESLANPQYRGWGLLKLDKVRFTSCWINNSLMNFEVGPTAWLSDYDDDNDNKDDIKNDDNNNGYGYIVDLNI